MKLFVQSENTAKPPGYPSVLQENYISGSTDRPYGVPKYVTDKEFVGMMIEAMSAQGYKEVRPA